MFSCPWQAVGKVPNEREARENLAEKCGLLIVSEHFKTDFDPASYLIKARLYVRVLNSRLPPDEPGRSAG